jgi:hypothetical protein
MTVQQLFHKYGCDFIADRAAQFLGDRDLKLRLLELAHEICRAEPVKNDWYLERVFVDGHYKLRIYEIEGSEDTFKTMSAGEIAGLDTSEIYPQKLKDVVDLLEDYSFFKL